MDDNFLKLPVLLIFWVFCFFLRYSNTLGLRLSLRPVLRCKCERNQSSQKKGVGYSPYGSGKGSSSVQCNAMISRSARLTWPSPLMSPAIIVSQIGSCQAGWAWGDCRTAAQARSKGIISHHLMSWKTPRRPGLSRPREFHPRPLREPDVNLSAHPAPIIQTTWKYTIWFCYLQGLLLLKQLVLCW